MKFYLFAALLALFVLILPADGQNYPYKSVAALQQVEQTPDKPPTLQNVCGAVSINEKDHLWLTAFHCIEDDAEHYILGDRLTPVVKDTVNDIAIVKTPYVSAPAVKLADTAPAVGDVIYTIAFPLGIQYPLLISGAIANPYTERPNDHPYIITQLAVAPGASGSPIFNTDGRIISVVQRGFQPHTYSPMGAGVTFDKMQSLALWWEK